MNWSSMWNILSGCLLTGWPVDEVVWLYSSELVIGGIHFLCKVTDRF